MNLSKFKIDAVKYEPEDIRTYLFWPFYLQRVDFKLCSICNKYPKIIVIGMQCINGSISVHYSWDADHRNCQGYY